MKQQVSKPLVIAVVAVVALVVVALLWKAGTGASDTGDVAGIAKSINAPSSGLASGADQRVQATLAHGRMGSPNAGGGMKKGAQ